MKNRKQEILLKYAAVEEALSNAVYHRAYDEREPIEVRVEKDRIEIVSFPGPDRSVTIEEICLRGFRFGRRKAIEVYRGPIR